MTTMDRRALILGSIVFGYGCASKEYKEGQPVLPAAPFLTKPTGTITIERQQFVNTWASVQVIWTATLGWAKEICAGPCADPLRCKALPEIEAQGKTIFLTVEAKLRNPEAEIDWENVQKILSLIAKMVL